MTFLTFIQRKAIFIQDYALEIYYRAEDSTLILPTTTVELIGNEYKLTLISHMTLGGQPSPYVITDTGQSSFLTKVQTLIDLILAELYE